jgi:hypothetical protein
MSNVPRQETNMATSGVIPNLDHLDLGIHLSLSLHLQHNNLELEQVPNCNMMPTDIMDLARSTAVSASQTNNIDITTHSRVDF